MNLKLLQNKARLTKAVLKSALHQCRGITLDIDATEVVSHKADAKWTYNKNKGYMPMVGHVAQTGQVVACDFRSGNAAPARENLEFIQQCEQSLPVFAPAKPAYRTSCT